eukprot:scaffold80043_cov36-Phaeocystis_antarctica.AAC.1
MSVSERLEECRDFPRLPGFRRSRLAWDGGRLAFARRVGCGRGGRLDRHIVRRRERRGGRSPRRRVLTTLFASLGVGNGLLPTVDRCAL